MTTTTSSICRDTKFTKPVDRGIRKILACMQDDVTTKRPPRETCDEKRYKCHRFVGSFVKGLERMTTPPFVLTNSAVEEFINLRSALRSENIAALDDVNLSGVPTGVTDAVVHNLDNPEGAFTRPMHGAPYDAFASLFRPPAFASVERSYEMFELYLMTGVRDILLRELNAGQTVSTALTGALAIINFENATPIRKYLTASSSPQAFTNENIFRPPFPRVMQGAFLSEFLRLDVPQISGGFFHQNIFQFKAVGNTPLIDFGDTINVAVNNQRCFPTNISPAGVVDQNAPPQEVTTPRELAQHVHRNTPDSFFMNAEAILRHANTPLNAYFVDSPITTPSVTGGGVYDISCCIREVTRIAIETAWRLKWLHYRSARPEEWAILAESEIIQGRGSGTGDVFVLPQAIRESGPLIEAIRFAHGIQNGSNPTTAVLPQVYPEGCPLSPSFPNGHAVVAGALATVLKAFYSETAILRTTRGGNVHGELEKLAWNISIGRSFAGVNYFSDSIGGLLIGEAVASEYLQEYITRLPERKRLVNPNRHMSFRSFSGATLEIHPHTTPGYRSMYIVYIILGLLITIAVLTLITSARIARY